MDFRWRPDIIVGIDFGMTCTGVAYSMGPDWADPKTIQRWPGKLGHELRNKVDTAVSYDIETDRLKSWGFLCSPDDDDAEFNELFKLYLDPHFDDTLNIAPTTKQAQGWFRDYMHCLKAFLDRYFGETVPRFESKRIEYVFSMPTTWKDPALTAAMDELIEAAGFGQNANEKASMYLTEAEAAAVYATRRMEKNEVFLVCDAGGGTTDLNVLKTLSSTQTSLELKPLSWTEGIAVGSTLIDFKVRRLLIDRLSPIKDEITGDLETVVSRLVDEDFKTFKCSFGVEGLDIPRLYMPISGLSPGKNFPELGIENSKLVILRDELQNIFDDQVSKMFDMIDKQLEIVRGSHPEEQISYLILSGGLSSSPYVQKCTRARYEREHDSRPSNARNMQVLLAAEPQLAVCHGLVMARTQEIRSGTDVFTMKCSPVSFGFLTRAPYDATLHQGQAVKVDFMGKRWATGLVNWIIKQGEAIPASDGVRKMYGHRLEFTETSKACHALVLMSTLRPDQLPMSSSRPGVQKVCEIEYTVPKQNMVLKNGKWYHKLSKKTKFYSAEYEVRAIIGAGLRFQIWGPDGRISKDHDEIGVKWQPMDGRDAAKSGRDEIRNDEPFVI